MSIEITALYAALNALIMIALAILVVRQRVLTNTIIGDGGDDAMTGAMRAHANNVEYVPYALILLLALENLGADVRLLHALGAALTLARVLHGYGLNVTTGRSFGRFVGVLFTWIVILAAAILILLRLSGMV